jgi:hypothetical protein
MSYGGPDDETLRLKVTYEGSPEVKTATDDLKKLKEETSALEAVMATLDTKTDEASASFKTFYTETTGLTAAVQTLEIKLEETGTGFTGLAAPIAVAQDGLDDLLRTVETTAGAGSGDSGTGGFAGLTRNIFMAERAMTALATGHGIARVGPMLEKLIGAAGGPAGVGFGIAGLAFLLETIGPKVKGFLESWAEASGLVDSTEQVKAMADELERALKAAEALEKTPTMQQAKTAAAVKGAITARGEGTIQQQIELALTQTTQLEEFIPEGRREAWESMKTLPFDPFGQKEKILTEARAARTKRAEAWTGQLQTDRASRQGLQQLAKAAPGVFGRGFLDELAMAEPEAQVEIEQQKRAETAAGKELQSGYGRQRKEKIKSDKERAHGAAERYAEEQRKEHEADQEMKHGAEQRYAEEQRKEREEKAAQDKAEREHQKAAREKKRQDDKYAREHTLSAQLHAATKRQHEGVERYVEAANQQFGFAQTAPQIEEVTRGAVANVNMGMDLATAVQQAVAATEMKIQRDFMRGMQRQNSYGEMRGQ